MCVTGKQTKKASPMKTIMYIENTKQKYTEHIIKILHSNNNKEKYIHYKIKKKKYLHKSIIQPAQTHIIAEPFH